MKNLIFTTLILILVLNGCKKKEETVNPSGPDPSMHLDKYLSSMTAVTNPAPVPSPQPVGEPIKNWNGSTYCETSKYKYGPEYNEGFLLNPQTDVIYPGAIIDGNSIYDGSYRLISLPRTGGTISIDLINASKASEKVDETIKSKTQQGIIDLLNQTWNGSSSGAQINFDIQDINSEKQIDIELGFTFGVANKGKIKGGFDFNQKVKKSRVLAKFQQIYYTISYDPKQRPADFFQPTVTSQDVNKSVNGTAISPVYVSNVKYGRLAYYSFESDMSQKDLKATLEAEFSHAKVSGSLSAEAKQKLINTNTSVKGTIIGGSGADAVQAVSGVEGFYAYILKGGDYSPTSPGLPIAYTLRRISDNGVFNVVNISEYSVNKCFNTVGSITLNSVKHISGSQDDHIWGDIKVNLGYDNVPFSNAPTTLWSKADPSVGINVPMNSTTIELNKTTYNLTYDPDKFNIAFIELSYNLGNRYSWSNIGLDKHSGTTDDYLSKKYRVYLKDIVNNKLGSDWSVNNSQSEVSYDLNVYMDGEHNTDNACVKKFMGGCTERKNFDVSKASSKMYFNYSINVETVNP